MFCFLEGTGSKQEGGEIILKLASCRATGSILSFGIPELVAGVFGWL